MKKNVLVLIVSLLMVAGKVAGQCSISGPSGSTSVCIGGIATLSVSVSGTNTYQWQYSADGATLWANVVDATPSGITYSGGLTNSLTVTGNGSEATGNKYYQCIVTGTSPVCGPTASSVATITVVADPTLSAPTALTTICLGGNTILSTTLSGGTGTFSYQWEYSSDGSSGWGSVSSGVPTGITYTGGATGSLTVTGDGTEPVASKYYRCIVTATGSGCGTATSATGQVTTVSDPALTAPAALTTLCLGGTTILSTTASGGTGSYGYQWQYSADGSTSWGNVSDATPAGITYLNGTTNSLTVTGSGTEGEISKYYRCVLTDPGSGCGTATSATAEISTVSTLPLTTPVALTTICKGGNATISTSVIGGSGSYTYQWQYSADGATLWANVVDATPSGITYSGGLTSSLTVTGAGTESEGDLYYQCIVSSSGCSATTSSSAKVTVVGDPSLSAPTALTTICLGGNTILSTTLSGGTGTFSYQWEYSSDGSSGWGSVSSGVPTGITYTGGATGSLTVTGDGTEPVASKYYRCIVTATGSGCGTATSATGQVTTVSDPALTAPAALTTLCLGGTTILSTTASGGTGSYGYQWQYSADGSTSWGNVSDATPAGITYLNGTTNSLTVTGSGTEGEISKYYRCVLTDPGSGCGTATSATAEISTVSTLPLTTPVALTTICKGGNATISTSVIGGSGSYTYQWQYSADGATLWANVVDATPSGITYSGGLTSSLTVTGAGTESEGDLYYQCIVSSSGCSATTSSSAKVTVVGDPSLSAPTALTTICLGGNTILSTTLSGGTGTFSYQWEYSSDGSSGWGSVSSGVPTGITYTGGATGSLTVTGDGTEPVASKYYRCIVTATGSGCGTATSATGQVTTVSDPALTAPAALTTLCLGGTTILSTTASGGTGSYGYQWQYSADGSTSWGNVSDATPAGITYLNGTTNSLTVTGNGTETLGSKYYRCAITSPASGCGPTNSATAQIMIVSDPALSAPAATTSICKGSSTSLSTTASGGSGSYGYQWQYSADGSSGWANVSNGTPSGITYTGGTTNSLTVSGNGTELTISKYYRCILTDAGIGCDPVNSATAQIVTEPDNATNLSFSGSLTVDAILTASYTFNSPSCFTEDITEREFEWWDASSSGGASPHRFATVVGDATIKLPAATSGKYIQFRVKISDGSTLKSQVAMTSWIGTVAPNSKPVASSIAVTGSPMVGQVLTGSYTYSDAENDPQGTSTFQWVRANASDGTGSPTNIGTSALTYTLTNGEAGKYIGLKVTPKATSGTLTGDQVVMASPWFGPVVANAPVASNVQVIGDPKSGTTVYGYYLYSDVENDPESGSTYAWYYADNSLGTINKNTVSGATSVTYKIADAYIGKFIGFSVIPRASSGVSPGAIATSPTFIGAVTNSVPVVSNVTITGPGTFNVNNILTGSYDYNDPEGDIEGVSQFEWLRNSTNTISGASTIAGATSISYQLALADTGKYIFFRVTPKAQTGDVSFGTPAASSATTSKTNTPPYAVMEAITYPTTVSVGQVLTGHYVYHDGDGNAEGTSTYRWLRNGTPIPGATSITYTVDLDDEGNSISFEVTPVSSTGYPNTGTAVTSGSVGPVPSSGSVPVASEVCIQGKREAGQALTGKYRYTFSKAEGTSTYRWLRGDDSVTVTVLATTINYTLIADDISSGKNIYFEVTPKSVDPVKTGVAVISTRLARITIPQDHYTNLVDTVKLTAIPSGGVFSGPGVTNGIFSPKAVGDSINPYQVRYLYNVVNSTTTCTQEDIKGIYVDPSSTKFSTVKAHICSDDAKFWVTVETIPTNAIPYTYNYHYTAYGYGYDYGFYINQPYYYGPDASYNTTNKGIVTEELSNSPYNPANTTPWKVEIDPSQLNPGVNYLYLYYSLNGYYYQLSVQLNVEEVGKITEISNLNASYCAEDTKQQITVYGLYPVGGTSTWSGTLITPSTTALDIAELDPTRGSPGNTYTIKYRYETINHCLSSELTKDVTINLVPNADFDVAPYVNIEGGAISLTPVVAPPTGIGASAVFIGAGVSVNKFYPDIAKVGTHDLEYKVKTAENCNNSTKNTVEVDKPTGTFNNLPSKICYSDMTYNVSMSDLPSDAFGYTVIDFRNKKNSLVWTPGSVTAQYNVAAARAGYDTLWFSYKRKGVDFTLSKGVFIDSIGNIQITGLTDQYCDYNGTATLRVLVENSTGSGNFSFSGPGIAFANYGLLADFYPSKAPTDTPYTISYTHSSSVNYSIDIPNCTKTETLPVIVNKSPTLSIFNTRTTLNINETPLVLSGSPSDGIFSGKGVYKSGSSFVFDPLVAGLGDVEFALSYTDSKGCSATKKDTLTVASATGSILGLNANNQYCYDGLKDTLTYTSSKPWTNGAFSGAGITNTSSAKAVFNPAAAGKGDHDIVFTYSDNYGTVFTVSATVNVDSLGVVEIKPLAAGNEYCNNDAPFELITTPKGGVFTGPVTTGYLNPSKALGDTAVTYTYLNVRTGCSITGRVPFRINPAPVVSFVPSDICIENATDSIRFRNNTTSADKVKDWLWTFSDVGGTDLSSKQTSAYVFKSGGQHLITLTATTINNCIVKKDLTVDLGVKPVADFYWKNECYVAGDSIMLFDTTFSTSAIVSRSWNFFDGGPLRTGTKLKYPKKAVGPIPVQYIVQTAYANCSDTVTKNIYVRPNIMLKADGYFENFESGNGGWTKGDEKINSWSFGTPDRKIIKSAASGSSAWFTRFDSSKVESSSVISPCFNFTGIERPMVSLGLWRNFNKDRDGASLQYKIGDAGTWQYVGSLDDGINWYNSVLIEGRPGGNQLGWTTSVPDPVWIEARHALDVLKGKKDVKFRIAYGSDGNARDNEGLAFDDISIGERKRNVLLEHFTNASSEAGKEANAMINAVDIAYDKDIVNIQYHTNFPGVDSFYVNNPGDASARILFYGLTKVPYSFVDGGTRKDYATIFDYSSRGFDLSLIPINSNEIIRRGLISPVFDIKLDSLIVSGGVLTISGDIAALEDTTISNLTLYLAVIEKTNSKYTGANGETLFRNVFRKFVPDAAGINLGKTWTKGTPVPIQDQTWIIQKMLNSSDIEVVAFIQNSVTKEVYQASSMLKPKITVGIEKPGVMDNIDFALYPNPAKHQLTIRFGEMLDKDTDIFIYDFGGALIKTFKAGSGETEFTIDDLGLKDGIYLIRVSSKGVNFGFRKLIISGS